MIETLKNELSKMFKNKMFILFIGFFIAFMCFSVYVYKDLLVQGKLSDFNRINFIAGAATDIIYKPVIPIFTIIMAFLSMEIFIGDYSRGVMKHEIIKSQSRKDYFIGKLSYCFIFLVCTSIIFYVITLVLGIIFFKGALTFIDIVKLLQLYLLNIIPNMSFFSLILLFSLYLKKGNGYKFLIIFLPIALSVVAKTKGIGWMLPLSDSYGIMNHLNLELGFDIKHQIICLAQIFIFSMLAITGWSKIEFEN